MFGLAVVGYLFLGGVGGGLCLVAGLAGFWVLGPVGRPNRQNQLIYLGIPHACTGLAPVLGTAFGAAVLALVAGALLLLADAGNYPALPELLFPPKPSLLSFGTWALALGAALSFALLVIWRGRVPLRYPGLLRFAHATTAIVGLAIALYTGLFLASMRAVPLWNTPLVPALFVLSSTSCGLVLFAVFAKTLGAAASAENLVRRIIVLDLAVVVLELALALAFVTLALLAPREGSMAIEAQSAQLLAFGPEAWLWWGVFTGAGIGGTLVLDVLLLRANGREAGRLRGTLAPAACVLCGALAMRYGIVEAGIHPVLGF